MLDTLYVSWMVFSCVEAFKVYTYGFCSQEVYDKFSALPRNALFVDGWLSRACLYYYYLISHSIMMRKWTYNNVQPLSGCSLSMGKQTKLQFNIIAHWHVAHASIAYI